MFKQAFAVIALMAVAGSISKQASADVPYLIPVVGKLTDASGTPLEGDHILVISLYDAETEGNQVWTDTFSPVQFTGGLFNLYLGSQVSSPLEIDDFLTTDEIWLEIKVGVDAPMSRVRLASIPWAMECEQVGNISADQAGQSCASSQYLQGWDENGPICIPDRLPSVTESGGTVTVEGDLKVNGNIEVNNDPPLIVMEKFEMGVTVNNFSTGYDAGTWNCFVGGFAMLNGDINENDTGSLIFAYTYVNSGTWYLAADIRSHNTHETHDIGVVCIRTSVSSIIGDWF